MTAKELRKQTEEYNSKKSSDKIIEIANLIKSSAKKGDFNCCYYGAIDTAAFEHFKALGFKIEEDYNRQDGTYYKINW